jgi:hypothetical protein
VSQSMGFRSGFRRIARTTDALINQEDSSAILAVAG